MPEICVAPFAEFDCNELFAVDPGNTFWSLLQLSVTNDIQIARLKILLIFIHPPRLRFNKIKISLLNYCVFI